VFKLIKTRGENLATQTKPILTQTKPN